MYKHCNQKQIILNRYFATTYLANVSRDISDQYFHETRWWYLSFASKAPVVVFEKFLSKKIILFDRVIKIQTNDKEKKKFEKK